MKPFDLERAEAGFPICYRDGAPAKWIGRAETATLGPMVFTLDSEDKINKAVEDGRGLEDSRGLFSGYHDPHRDLFMASRKKTIWLNVYPEACNLRLGVAYKTKSEADESASCDVAPFERLACLPIEVEL